MSELHARTVTVTLFGSPQVALNGTPCHFGSTKALALLAYLALSNQLHDRAELAALLWPESDNKRARGALRYTLSRIRKELGDGYILADNRQMGLDPEADWQVDVAMMRFCFRTISRLFSALNESSNMDSAIKSISGADVATIEQGVALYRADFLHGFTLRDAELFNEWVFFQAEELRREFAAALQILLAYYEERQQWGRATAHARRWLSLNTLDESVHCRLLTLYAAAGEWAALHSHYASLVELVEREMGVPPLEETQTLYAQLCQEETRVVSAVSPAVPAPLSTDQRAQQVLRKKMQRFWIDEFLLPLYEQHTFIRLQMLFTYQPIEHPWADVLETPASLPESREVAGIQEAFLAADRALLVLGAPGAGKTISLAELANLLLLQWTEQKGSQDDYVLPVILNLSNWSEQRTAIDRWVVDELVAKYQIPRRWGRKWLERERLLFLLDGLDEVTLEWRGACITAINTFRQDHGLADLVVSCRQDAYQLAIREHNVRLQLNGAVILQPLTQHQIAQIAKEDVAQLIFSNRALQETAQSPLMLSLLQQALPSAGQTPVSTAVSHDPSLQDDAHAFLAGRKEQIVAFFVAHMLQRQMVRHTDAAQSSKTSYSALQTTSYLAWLAYQMQQHHQAIFLIEQIQPSWLGKLRLQWAYLYLTRLLISLFIGTLATWCFIQLIAINPPHFQLRSLQTLGTAVGITHSPWTELVALAILIAAAGIVAGTVDGLFFIWCQQRQQSGIQQEGQLFIPLGWLHLIVVSAAVWATVALPIAAVDAWPLASFIGGLQVLGGIMTYGYLGYGQSFRTEIRSRGALQWSWRNAAIAGGIGVGLSLLWSAIIWLQDPSAVAWQLNVLSNGLMLFLLGGITGRQPEVRNRPNEGTRIAWRNGIQAILYVALLPGLLVGLTVTVASGLYTALMMGLLASTAHGLNDVIKHGIVRLLLWYEKAIPLNSAALLNHAADSALLRRVGGAYTFRHRLIQDYFAETE